MEQNYGTLVRVTSFSFQVSRCRAVKTLDDATIVAKLSAQSQSAADRMMERLESSETPNLNATNLRESSRYEITILRNI